jgi:hypothetical protein
MLRVRGLQLPHLVFIRCTKNRSTLTPNRGCHFAINGGTACLNSLRYHASTISCLFPTSARARTRRGKQGDYAYLLHIVRSLKSAGKGACILPHGVLFRGNAEAEIRRNLVRKGR